MSERLQRANAEIQKSISEIILYSLKDPRLSGLITVTDVKTSPDFKHAKVQVSVMSKDDKERNDVFDLLKGSGTFIRTELIKKVKLPTAPKLAFVLDEGYIHYDRINEILQTLVIPPLEEEDQDGDK
jgi:ribosome-binding factor A